MGLLPRRATLLLLAAVALGVCAGPAEAQYFGTNKVQYKRLRFQVLETEHFDVYFYTGEREGAEMAARLAERWHTRLSDLFDHTLRGRQPLVLYASQVDFQQTNVIPDEIGEGTGGVTEPLRRRIVLPLAGPLADTDHVIGHELVHAFQYDMTERHDRPGGAGLAQLPLWFVEGMAEYLTLGPADAHTAMWLRDVARLEKLPAIRDLDDPKYFPYRWGHAFWAYVGGRWSDQVIGKMLATASVSGDVNAAIEKVLGLTAEELSKQWQATIRQTYSTVLATSTAPPNVGTATIGARRFGGEINVGPAISPDGRWIAFLSERSFFSMDLFVADATTGAIVRKLTDTASNPHYASLQFVYSAGAWDVRGRRIAVATVTDGRPALAIFGWPGGAREREVIVPGVDEIVNPTWSPDGRSVAFTGIVGGLTDLFAFDLEAAAVTRLTHDAFADVQPSWAPDGRRIAFATDRFTTDLDTLAAGPYRLAVLDVASGMIQPAPAFANGKHLNPQWSRDGSALYFIGDPDGIANVFRVSIASGEFEQLTTAATGVSGITASSPALSVAAAADVAAITVYSSRAYEVHMLPLDRAGAAPRPASAQGAAALPPLERKPSAVAAMLADARRGLPPPAAESTAPYKPSLSLETAGQTMVALGVDRFGASIGAGIGVAFSDMLNNRRVAALVQFSTGLSGSLSLKDTAGQLAYVDRSRRWNWGVAGGQIPYLSGTAQSGIGMLDGQPVVVEQVTLYRQTERAASGLVAYPFNRARRVELQGGMTQVSFDQTIRTDAYSLATGNRVLEDVEELPGPGALTFGTTSAAFVSDTSHVGAVSPVQGERYRLEVAPAFGTIHFASVLSDYRRYVMPVSFYTIAARALHYGRYGSGGDDGRLVPLYLGYPTLVRGYDVNSFSARECGATPAGGCPVFDRLLGSRVAVGNVELRFPLLRPFGISQRMYGPLPVEVAVFADGGVAWRGGERPSILGGSRRGVSSAGLTLRVNLMGFAVGQFDAVRPFQRPDAGWVFQFSLAPGF